MNPYTIGLIIGVVLGGISSFAWKALGRSEGHAEATCWARGTTYIDTTSIGVVCGDGAVVPVLSEPKETP